MMPLTAICRPELTELQVRGYFAALGDLAPDTLAAAVQRIAATRVISYYPMPGEIRKAADEIVAGPSLAPIWGEAWELAMGASKRWKRETDPAYRIKTQRHGIVSSDEYNALLCASLPAPVVEALRMVGPVSLKDDSTCRAQFRDIYTAIVERDRQGRLLPAALADQIAAIGARSETPALPASPARAIAGKIGVEPAA